MEFNHYFRDRFLYKSIHQQISKIQIPRFKTQLTPQKVRTTRGLILIFLSLVLAWLAQHASAHQAIYDYRESHWPGVQSWKSTLKEYGLSQRLQLSEAPSLLLNHPDAFSNRSVIWSSLDGCALYVPQSPYFEAQPELWTCKADNSLKVKEWKEFGSGIAGFERLTAFLETLPKKNSPNPVPIRNWVDPKEIRY